MRSHRTLWGWTTLALWAAPWGWAAETPRAPLVPAYGAMLPAPVLNDTESAIIEELRKGREQAQALTVDPALCKAAAAHAGQFGATDTPDTFADGKGSVRYWLDAAGVSTVLVRAGCAKVDAGADAAAIIKALRPAVNATGMTHVGVAAARAGEKQIVTVIAAARRTLLEPIPIQPQPGATYRLGAKLGAGAQGGRVLLTRPDGQTVTAAACTGRELAGELRLGKQPGTYIVEFIELSRTGPTLTDALRLHVATPYPAPFAQRRPKPAAAAKQAEPKTPEQMAAALIDGINKLRMKNAIMPLRRNAKLMKIARYNSQELARRRDGKLDTRLANIYVRNQIRCKAFGVAPYVASRLPDAAKIRLGLNAVFTEVGIGIVKGDFEGKPVLWITVIFIETQ